MKSGLLVSIWSNIIMLVVYCLIIICVVWCWICWIIAVIWCWWCWNIIVLISCKWWCMLFRFWNVYMCWIKICSVDRWVWFVLVFMNVRDNINKLKRISGGWSGVVIVKLVVIMVWYDWLCVMVILMWVWIFVNKVFVSV